MFYRALFFFRNIQNNLQTKSIHTLIAQMEPVLLEPGEKKNLRQKGRDALYREYGVRRDTSLERLAVSTLGDNARRRDIDSWKRNECQKRFLKMPRDRQIELCPDFAAFHADVDERERVLKSSTEVCPPSSTGSSSHQPGTGVVDADNTRQAPTKRKRGQPAKKWDQKKKRAKVYGPKRLLQSLAAHSNGAQDMAILLSNLVRRACASTPGLADELGVRGVNVACHCSKFTAAFKNLLAKDAITSSPAVRLAVGQAVVEAGFRNRRAAMHQGLAVTRRVLSLVLLEVFLLSHCFCFMYTGFFLLKLSLPPKALQHFGAPN